MRGLFLWSNDYYTSFFSFASYTCLLFKGGQSAEKEKALSLFEMMQQLAHYDQKGK